jgi:YD repeat-containing protein
MSEEVDNMTVVLESYLYLGLSTVVERDHPETEVNLTYISQTSSTGDAGDQYVGLDRFGRVVDQNWYNTDTETSTDDFQYGYDRNGNRLWRDNLVNTDFGELYSYDSLNQLASFQRGELNSTKTGLEGSASRSQSWEMDALGNFTSVTTDETEQDRSANAQNEITSIDGLTTPEYDSNGNMTLDQNGNTLVYDAWNRLVGYLDGETTLQSYQYDGLNRRIVEDPGTATDLYYSSDWQVLEEQVDGVATLQYVWSPVYVDAMVLRDQLYSNGTLEERLYVQQDANWNGKRSPHPF